MMWNILRTGALRGTRTGLARTATLFLVCAALASTAGCVLYLFFPRDMEIRVLGVVDRSRIHEVFGSGFWVPDREAIVVEVASRTDWIRFARIVSGPAIKLRGDFCDGKGIRYMVSPSLLFNGERVGWELQDLRRNVPPRNEAGLYVVQGYIYVRHGGSRYDYFFHEVLKQDFLEAFDLEKEPRDICVYVMAFPIYKSSEVRISRDEIAAALLREL